MLPEHPPEVFHSLIERTLHLIVNVNCYDVNEDDDDGGDVYDGDGGVDDVVGPEWRCRRSYICNHQ